MTRVVLKETVVLHRSNDDNNNNNRFMYVGPFKGLNQSLSYRKVLLVHISKYVNHYQIQMNASLAAF